jgi:hypothetical protein
MTSQSGSADAAQQLSATAESLRHALVVLAVDMPPAGLQAASSTVNACQDLKLSKADVLHHTCTDASSQHCFCHIIVTAIT